MSRGAFVLIAAGGFLLAGEPAEAFPKFARKENKPCAHCHVKAKGGGARNAAGRWYEHHGFSFKGYKPAAVPNSKRGTALKKKTVKVESKPR